MADPDRCPTCAKRAYRSWREAARAARSQRRQRGIVVVPYYSRRCQTYHVGSALKRMMFARERQKIPLVIKGEIPHCRRGRARIRG